MLQLTAEQQAALARPGREAFLDKLARHLRRVFPAEMGAFGDAELRGRLDGIIERSAAIGLDTELEVASMAEYLLVFGLDLDGELAARIAGSARLTRRTKLQRLGVVALYGWAARGAGG
jgi:hypothetical protein